MAKVKVILHGELKKIHPEDIWVNGDTPAEILSGLSRQVPEFNKTLGNERYQVSIPGYETKEMLYYDLAPTVEELHVVPDICGGKSGGFAKIVIGALIIAAIVFTGGAAAAGAGLAGGLGVTSAAGVAAVTAGVSFAQALAVSLIIGGITELISPAPKLDVSGGSDPTGSNYLSAQGNTTKIGQRIPVAYGTNKLYGHYISFNIDSKDIAL